MCGIAGSWSDDEGARARDETRRRTARLRHRGPDDRRVRLAGRGTLGHARLAIIDPRHGEQPHVAEDRRTALVANGEIYNHLALRSELAPTHDFVGGADTEVALHLLEEGETSQVARLDGMFALALQRPDELVLARDPLGIKPLYLGHAAGGGLRFASEMKALQDVPGAIEELAPGSVWSSRTGSARYYRVPEARPELTDPDEAAREVRRVLQAAVEKRLMSDVPLGAFLSGGLDSSAIAALAVRARGRLHTFSVGVEGAEDLEAARAVARHLGTDHHELVFAPDEVERRLDAIVHALESFDRDLVRSAIPTFLTAELAARHVKVVLTGEGADELFAGYAYVRSLRGARLARELGRSLAAMHNVNLQRVDRMTMAHSVEARVPFLDTAMIDLAQRVDPALKLRRGGGRTIEKWVLRRAVEDLLPREVVWRDKAQFDEGSGTADVLAGLAAGPAVPRARLGVEARSDEEARYLDIFASLFPRGEAMVGNLGRWVAPQS